MKKEERNYGIDLVRIIATLCVISVHFFLKIGYYNYDFKSNEVASIFEIIRNFFMICVPLFIIITGSLNNKTEYNKSFFKSLLNILIVWFFYSLIEFIALSFSNHPIGALNIISFVESLTKFNACEYSWYIKMYIGLYLLSPVINNAYNSFNKKNRLYLLLVSIFIFILPSFINEIWENIALPDWWIGAYPIAYYICGKYIADKKISINKKTLFFTLILTQILSFFISDIAEIDYYTITTFISSIIVFLLIYDVKIKHLFLQKIIKYISNISLDIYLGSSLIDKIIYSIFNAKIINKIMPFEWSILFLPITILIVFLLSILYGSIRKLIINVR